MTKFFATILAFAMSASAFASIVNFDDGLLQGGGSYAGFNWDTNFYSENNASYDSGYGNTYGSVSGDWAAYNGYGVMSVTTTGGSPFKFVGAYFTGWALNDAAWYQGSNSITVEGYLNGNLVDTASMNLSFNQYDYLSANFAKVDELRFIGDGNQRWWLMDNFETASVVPVPAAALLGGLGIVIAFGLRRMYA